MSADLLPLALAAALYPLLLAAAVIMLGTPRPTPILLGYLAGGMVVSIGLGLAIVSLIGQSSAATSSRSAVGPSVDLAAGLLLLAIWLVLWRGWDRRLRERRAPREAKPEGQSWTQRHLARGSPWVAALVGAALSLPSVYYLTALRDIAEDQSGTPERLGLIVAFNLVAFALIEIPLVCYLVVPDGTRMVVGRVNAWIGAHTRQIGEGVALVLGVYLTVRGITGLA